MNKSPLKGKTVYLSGPIEHASEDNWRENPCKVLSEEFGMNIIDPNADEKQKWTSELNEARKNKDFKTMRDISKRFVRKDLGWVDRSDILIAYLPHKFPTTGTHHEIIFANNAKKPTLLICEQGKEFIPVWYYGFIGKKDDEYMFDSWEGVYRYLREVNESKHTDNFDWALVYGLV